MYAVSLAKLQARPEGCARVKAHVEIWTEEPTMLRHLALLIMATFFTGQALAAPRVGAIAPTLSATLIDGQTFQLEQHKGHVVLVTFWATWCPPCVHEMPELERLYQTYHEQGLDILGVSMDEASDIAKVREYAKSVHFPVALVSQAQAVGYGRIWGVPLLFVVDRNGVLREDGWPGLKEKDYPELERRVRSLLSVAP